MDKQKETDLKSHLAYNLWVKVVVLVVVFAVDVSFGHADWQSKDFRGGLILIVLLSIFGSALYLLRYLRVPIRPLRFKLAPGVEKFPVSPLAWDFVNLAALVLLTGGISSMFLPLSVVALLAGDICVEHHDRWPVRGIFVLTLLIAIILSESDGSRCWLVSGSSSCAKSMWNAPREVQTGLVLVVFFAGAIFGSRVVEVYVEGDKTRQAMKPVRKAGEKTHGEQGQAADEGASHSGS
jgi:hypothetical protein